MMFLAWRKGYGASDDLKPSASYQNTSEPGTSSMNIAQIYPDNIRMDLLELPKGNPQAPQECGVDHRPRISQCNLNACLVG